MSGRAWSAAERRQIAGAKVFPPAGEKRVRICRVQSRGVDGVDGDFLIEMDAGLSSVEWQRVAAVKCLSDAQRIRTLIVRAIQAEVGARLGKFRR